MEHLSQVGGMFAALVFLHFIADFVWQTQEEAIKKSSCWKTRAGHCFDYIISFVALFAWIEANPIIECVSLAVLFASHFVIDTYFFTYVWAKYWRRIPSIYDALTGEESKEAFKNEFKNPVNAILFITIDQLQHITFLMLVAWLLVK